MARMFPEELPREVLEDSRRSSEVLVYNALRDQLSDKYHVYYSSPWLGTNPDGSEIDGESDFLVAHSEKGMLSIEVKGGIVGIDNNDQWTSIDRHRFKRDIKNPVQQARSSKYQLLKKLKESPHWQPRFICARHGVILPHSVRPARDFRPDMPLKLFAFDTDMNVLEDWVTSRLGSGETGDDRIRPLGDDGLYALDDMLARTIQLRVSLSTNVNQDMKDIKLKTDDQIFIIREMEDNHRMAISGAAGTGKTVLAIEKAMILAENNKRVLLLCFNRPLGSYLKHKLEHLPTITATHFHQFCRDVAKAAGVKLEGVPQTVLAESLVDNFTEAGLNEYDAIIIDEGQDFSDDWLTTLEVVVKAGNDGVLYIFYDDNQNVMSTSASYIRELPLAKHHLTRNFRNTRSIFQKAEHYYEGDYVRPIGPEGTEPKLTAIGNSDELKAKLADRIGSLTQTEGIQQGDIAILFPHSQAASILKDDKGYRVGRNRASDAEHRNSEQVVVDTVRRFKGLESAVILLVVDGDVAKNAELLYVGMTRAQAVLEVFGPEHVLRALN
jgi:hypothetical protein